MAAWNETIAEILRQKNEDAEGIVAELRGDLMDHASRLDLHSDRISNLIERITEIEEAVVNLKTRVASLELVDVKVHEATEGGA
jgi:chromosome segregation ATPase